MEFRVVWPLIQQYVRQNLKTCGLGNNCKAAIKNMYHMWSNHSQVHIRVQCEEDHYQWVAVPIRKLYAQLEPEQLIGLGLGGEGEEKEVVV